MTAPEDHARAVDAWLGSAIPGLTGDAVLTAFDGAFRAVWMRAHVPLGEITLAAVMERVLHDAATRHTFLSAVVLEPDGIRLDALAGNSRNDDLTVRALRGVLVEFLKVLANLTDDIITPSLHASLAKLATGGSRSEGTGHGEA